MRKNLIVLGVLFAILVPTNFNQAISQTQQQATSTNKTESSSVLAADTPIRLRLGQTSHRLQQSSMTQSSLKWSKILR